MQEGAGMVYALPLFDQFSNLQPERVIAGDYILRYRKSLSCN